MKPFEQIEEMSESIACLDSQPSVEVVPQNPLEVELLDFIKQHTEQNCA